MLIILLGSVCLPVLALGNSEMDQERAFDLLDNQKRELIVKYMQLTVQESEAFWPIYNDYQQSFRRIAGRMIKLIKEFAKEHETLPDENARAMLDEYFLIEEEKLSIKKSYLNRFRTVLPPKKVLWYYQLENKIEIGFLYEVASKVPFVK
jgi:hypothetical protein